MKKFLYVTVLIFAFASIGNSIHAMYDLLHKRDLLEAAQKSLAQAQDEHKKLTNQLERVSGTAFVEEEARNKLFFIKHGENTVFIAKELLADKPKEVSKPVEKSNWEQWISLFMKS